jgi:hypothetical protein
MTGGTPTTKKSPPAPDLEAALAALSKDYAKLGARIHSLTHTVTCTYSGVTLRLHFPALRQSKATILELIDAVALYLVHFALPRTEVESVKALHGTLEVNDFMMKVSQLDARAKHLFIQANKATNRNGEAGELLLYLLTEWVLGAPQLIAKMSLKTNPAMPVHGADGVHVRYSKKDKRLYLYWGEAKFHAKLPDAISAAAKSISDALKPQKLKHEIELVQRNISFSGLDNTEKEALLRHLDPFADEYGDRHDISTCLIGFDFNGYLAASKLQGAQADAEFAKLAADELKRAAPLLAKAFKSAGLASEPIELFFFPVPSVRELRDLFQNKIGWKQ